MAARRGQKDAANGIGLYPELSWCWPVNRRIIYNRASVDLNGEPWDKNHWVIRWAGEQMDRRRPGRRLAAHGQPRQPQSQEQMGLYHAQARSCPDLRAGPGGRALPGTLRTPGMPGGKEPHERPAHQPRGPGLQGGSGRLRHLRPAVPLSWAPPTGSPSTGRRGS